MNFRKKTINNASSSALNRFNSYTRMKDDENFLNKKTKFYQKFFHKKINELKERSLKEDGESSEVKGKRALKPYHRKSKTLSQMGFGKNRLQKATSESKLKDGREYTLRNQKSLDLLNKGLSFSKEGKKKHRKVYSSGFMLEKFSTEKDAHIKQNKKTDIGSIMKKFRSESEKKVSNFKINKEGKSFKRRGNSGFNLRKKIEMKEKEKKEREASDKLAITKLEEKKHVAVKKPRKKKSFPTLKNIRENEKRLPKVEKSKVIIKDFGVIKSFAVNTHVGTVRSYNEDRVSILLNAQQR